MLRACLWIVLIAATCTIHFSKAVSVSNCSASTFTQQFDAVQLAASNIVAEDYATITGDELSSQLADIFNDTALNINCTVTRVNNTVSFNYQVIYACNETITTNLTNGTTATTQVNSKINTTRVKDAVSCGLFEISLFCFSNLKICSS